MIRLMQPEDLPAMKTLWDAAFGVGDDVESVIRDFAGMTHAWVDERDGQIAAMLLTPPVQLGSHKGVYLCGLATAKEWQKKGIATAMMKHVLDLLAQVGVEFAALIPENESLVPFYEARGFQKAFARRSLERPLTRNLWSRAEFDTVPVRSMSDLRVKFCPKTVQFTAEATAWCVADLYKRGMTVVSNDGGYGMYLRKGDCLHFAELMAKSDDAVTCLLQAVREREVVAERAVFTVPDDSSLFLGEGRRYYHGMIRFLAQPFDLEGSYLGLALDV